MKHKSTLTLTSLVFAVALTLAGCGSDSSDGGSDQVDSGSGNSDSDSAASVMDPSAIKTADSSLGTILVDNKGRTLYLFTEDGNNKNSMQCDVSCLKLWPPVEGKPKAGSGTESSKINTTEVDGTTQATYAGHPLYYYAEDAAAGDVKGQGIDKIWYVLDASGKAITAAPDTSDDDATTGGYDY